MDNIKLNLPPVKLKIQDCFTLYFKFWECTSVKIYRIQLPVLLFWFRISFYTSRYHFFYNYLKLHSRLSAKYFCHKFPFFSRFTQTHHSLNNQNLLSVTNVFCRFSLRCLLKFFKNICWQNPAKASFVYQQWTATVHMFLKVPATDSLVLFSEHISRTAILTQASVITCK